MKNGHEDRYRYLIRSRELPRPMEELTHVAKVTRMFDVRDQVDVAPSTFSEAWGAGDADARAKMKEKVEEWIASQDS